MSGPNLALLLTLLAALLTLTALLFSLERYHRRHAAWIAHQRALAGTEQQDTAALTAGAIREGWTDPTQENRAA
ncbi:hypothetical protein ACFVDT_07100 [Streptomyces sp. NPDC057699]|uniref:hypothetical protein n=1 Tax=Streptomyces sp. NPDC057699 TaxID=3346220 RepID=UPI0036BFAA25